MKVMDRAFACFAGGPGLIPALGKSKKLFLPIGKRWLEKEPGTIIWVT